MKFKVPVIWQNIGYYVIDAQSVEDAIKDAEKPETPLPTNGVYLEDSFTVDIEGIEVINE
jgi:hypothetical protein